MKLLRFRFALLGTLILLSFGGGCAVNIGAGSGRMTPTVGQQIIDLQKARDSGAIFEAEYETQRAKLLNQAPPTSA